MRCLRGKPGVDGLLQMYQECNVLLWFHVGEEATQLKARAERPQMSYSALVIVLR